MSDNEDLLGDDLGDQSLADYNLGNEEEEQLLADDYESGGPQNVPVSMSDGYSGAVEMVPNEYSNHPMEYAPPQPIQYQPVLEAECVVPNITVEVPNLPPQSYVPTPRHYQPEHAVPPAILAGPVESPQIVPSEAIVMPSAAERERFVTERPVAHRLPIVRDIPDSLDKVVIPRGFPRGRVWRAPHLQRPAHPYRRNNAHRGNFNPRNSFPPPQVIRPNIPQQVIRQEIRPDLPRPDNRPDIRPEMDIRPDNRPDVHRPDIHRPDNRPDVHREIRPDIHNRPDINRPDLRQDIRPDIHREIRPDIHREIRPDIGPIQQMGPEISPERPILPDMSFRHERAPFPFPRYQFRPEEGPPFQPGPRFERPGYPYPRQFNPRFGPPMREIAAGPVPPGPPGVPHALPKEPEVRMLPLARLPPLPPAAPPPKKVLINPHFKGNFQPPVEGLPAYIPTRIQKSPPPSPTKFGPVKDIDDAAERFIAEQRNALARAAGRKFAPRRSPQRYIENTTIEIENELAARPRRADDDDLLRRQEEFINANRAGLRRRMRSPSPAGAARRSPSPRRARADRAEPPRAHHDEESEYKRRVREQESLRERVLRAKEVRRRKNAVALHRQLQDREREPLDKPSKDKEAPAARPDKPEPTRIEHATEEVKPDTTRTTPERKSPEKTTVEKPKITKEVKEKEKREKSPVKAKDDEVNSTCEALTPPRVSPARTPPWPGADSEDDDLDMILGDIDGILSDEDSGRFKDKPVKAEPPSKPKPVVDLRAKLPPKLADKPPRQKIVFHEDKKEKSPPRRAVVTSTRADAEPDRKHKAKKVEPKPELSTLKNRPRITFGNKQKEPEKEKEKDKADKTPPFSNRRVILQRKPSRDKLAGDRQGSLFSRAVRTAIGDKLDNKLRKDEPQIEYESDSDIDEDKLLNEEVGNVAVVSNLPHGMTDTRLKTLAGADLQSLVLDKEERSAKITFKTSSAAETFKKKFHSKMVAASRLTVVLR